jgi:ABC-type sugar transport system permease subunit
MADSAVPVTPAFSPGMPLARPPRVRLSPAEHRRLSRRYEGRRALIALGFLLPNLIFFVVFLVVPVFQVIIQTFQSGGLTGKQKFVGLQNWQNVFNDPVVVQSLQNSARYAVVVIPAALILGLAVALLLQRIRRGGATLRAFLYFPTLAPVVIAGLVWLFLVDPDFGAFNLALRAVGGQPQVWLGNSDLALPTIAGLEIWRAVGFWALFFLASLIGLPRELYDAAHLDGAGAWGRFRYVTLPLMRRVILFALVLATIYNLQIFDSVFVMTDGGPANTTATAVWYIYKSLFQFERVGFGAALSFLLLALILVLTLIQMRWLRPRRGA